MDSSLLVLSSSYKVHSKVQYSGRVHLHAQEVSPHTTTTRHVLNNVWRLIPSNDATTSQCIKRRTNGPVASLMFPPSQPILDAQR